MSNELKVFENEEFGKVRVINANREVWLVGKDVVEALGYDLSGKHVASEYIKKYCDKEDYILLDKNSPLNHGSVLDYKQLGQRGGYLINESGLYSLVFESKLTSAKKFKHWVTSEVLPTIRKTGGYINNSDLMINTYFGSCDEASKTILKGLLTNIEEQQKKITALSNEVTRKEDVIIGLTKNIDLAEKRQRISQIVKYGSKKYAERYNLLYSEFNKKYHMDIDRRLENDKQRGEVKMSMNKMAYICDYMDMTNELYDLACKIFEGEYLRNPICFRLCVSSYNN